MLNIKTSTLYKRHIARCYYSDDSNSIVFWRLCVAGNIKMIVDTATCMDIANDTDSKEYMNYAFSNLDKLKKNDSYVVPLLSMKYV